MKMKRFLFQKKIKKNYSKGFTIIECLVSLLVLSIICLLFSSIITNARITAEHLKNSSQKEWQIFLIQLENELKTCHYQSVDKNKFVFKNKKNEKVVWIEFKLGKIVKVENNGYQPMLINVKQAIFEEERNYIQLTIIFENEVKTMAKFKVEKKDENTF